MSRTWFTSDLHLGHRYVAGLRGFGEDTQAHDASVEAVWSHWIASDDVVYVLGDLSCGNSRDEDRALDIVNALPGTKHLIAGNHDSVASIHRQGWKRMDRYREVFTSVRDFARLRMHKEDILLSHYPYTGPGAEHPGYSGEIRYEQFRLPDRGLRLIHGHTHIADQFLHLTPKRTRQVHVGWDAWSRPVALAEVEYLLFDLEAP